MSAASPTSTTRSEPSWPRSNPSGAVPTPSGFSCRRPSALPTSALWPAFGDAGAEWVTFDTTVLFETPPVTDAEREAWTKKPRLPRRSRALTSHPVVRYIGRDDAARTAAGWQHWLDTVTSWLREGRSPTVFIHTPDNVDALELARRFHDEVRARVPEVEPLPEPIPSGPPALF